MSQTSGILSRTSGNSAYFPVLGSISLAHALNDTMQSLLLASYPLFKSGFDLSFAQIGLITLAYQCTASLLQPLIGTYTDRHPQPFSLVVGMAFTFSGLLLLAHAHAFYVLLLAAALVGSGSSIFHPEASRVARLASGGQHGLAQSIFQVGGNAGSAIGPLLAAWFVLPRGQSSLAMFSLMALGGMLILSGVGVWYQHQHRRPSVHSQSKASSLPTSRLARTMSVLVMLMFSKFIYMASISSYLIFYLMHHYGISAQKAQYHLFYFLFAVAAGTVLGGPLGDRIGRKPVIWISILGIAPFTLALPYVSLAVSVGLMVLIGFLLASAFPAMVVYAQELMPGRTGMVSGLFFGLAFGLGGVGAAMLGSWADHDGIDAVYRFCSFLPLLGVLAVFLPDLKQAQSH